MIDKVNANNWKSALLALFSFIFESFIFAAYLSGLIYLIPFALMHLCIVLVLTWFTYRSYKRGEDLRFPLMLLFSVFGTGPFGAGGFLLCGIIYPIFSLFTTMPEVWFEELFPEPSVSSFAKIYQRVTSGWDDFNLMSEVATFQDIFNYGTLTQKQAVLDAIIHDFNPVYSPILKEALKDPHNTVRIQAAAIMSKLDLDFSAELTSILAEQKKNPDDPALLLRLGKQYDTYVFFGILDPIREREIGERAIACYQDYLKINPDDRQVWFSIGRLLFHLKDYDSFLIWCEEYREKYKQIPAIVQAWYLDALYRLKRYDELSQRMKER